MNKTTLIIGASENPERYSNKAALSLMKHGHSIYLLGNKAGQINGVKIETDQINYTNLDTVTLYINSTIQTQYKEYIYSLKPKRIIFNPGAENSQFFNEASQKGIECVEACTLVMLSIGNY
ncbi:MAG: CoA-binding protein [Bacteroidota bacterium]|nr:CoA-binding protein [Bacteroidota bacterium]